MQNLSSRELLQKCLVLLLRPAVSFCLRHSLRLQDLIECAKVAFVERSQVELSRIGTERNVSRLSAMTGVHRRDVQRCLDTPLSSDLATKDPVTKVIGHWQSSKQFSTKGGRPRALSVGDNQSEFARLVEHVSKDLHPGSIQFELERVKAVEVKDGKICLHARNFAPKEDPLALFEVAARDTDDLDRAVEENIFGENSLPHLHARTEYDNVRPEKIEELRRWLLKEGHAMHERVRKKISSFDQDINPVSSFVGKGLRVVFGAFSYVEKK